MSTPKMLRRRFTRSAVSTLRPRQPTASAAARGWSLAARWFLLAAVIAGVVAMHILSAADTGGNHQPMAMTSASGTSPAESMSMVMDMPATQSQISAAPAVAGIHPAADGMGMSVMSCCVLSLVSAVGLVLLIRSYRVHTAAAAGSSRGPPAPSTLQRGPPGPGRPRIALSVQRV